MAGEAAGPALAAVPPRPALSPRPVALPRPGREALARSKPDPTGHRLAIGFGALAAASALATAFLAPATAAAPATSTTVAVAPDAVPVQHVVQYVQLQPGQTPPPNATVSQAAPAPTPRVVVVTTRQSGTKR
ncbi:MAG TPA: hypothetical protein VJ506_09420 [Candidatus Limnocylindrales bacterium]|nr:hypothetical protein [Candidatus Limnocylindrales bacterium]